MTARTGMMAALKTIAGHVRLGLAAAMIAAFAAGESAAQDRLLGAPFQDHAVVQRDRPINVWGQARAGERVSVTMNGRTVRARANRNGAWRAALPALPAGGPYEIEARAGSSLQRISDVLVGDVFLCSGQSNMEWSVSASNHGGFEVMRSANDRIRLLNVAKATAAAPRDDWSGAAAWAVASPESVGPFSGVCFFFGRDLQRRLDVPIGLINASWGGARIEPWMSGESLRALEDYAPRMDLLSLYARDPGAGLRQLGESWEAWWRTAAPQEDEPWQPNAGGDWRPLPEPMRDWRTWGVAETQSLTGMVWFRRTVTLTAAQAAQASTIALGSIDEVDNTWINGRHFANTFGWGDQRVYSAQPGVFHEGENTIVVNVLSTWDAGGMLGPPDRMRIDFADGETVSLAGEWRYRLAPAGVSSPPRAPWESVSGLSGMYNAMVAPLGPYGLRGVTWYQGESNTGEAEQYEALLGAWMSGWRAQFGAQTPFFIVQLPNFGAPVAAPTDSDWASLRESQRRAVAADPRAALVVTIDAGDRADLHPPNKQIVGTRMARAARSLIYGEDVTRSGPAPVEARRAGNEIVVRFSDVEGDLVAYNAAGPFGFELCGAAEGSCSFVNASLRDNAVVLNATAAAQRVRYCWGDGPVCNLYDRSGLPAGPFELTISE